MEMTFTEQTFLTFGWNSVTRYGFVNAYTIIWVFLCC